MRTPAFWFDRPERGDQSRRPARRRALPKASSPAPSSAYEAGSGIVADSADTISASTQALAATIPEPASYALLGAGLLAFGRARRQAGRQD